MQTVGLMAVRALMVLVVLLGCRRAPEAPVVVQPPSLVGDGGPSVTRRIRTCGSAECPPDAGPLDAGPDPHRIGGLGSGPFPADPVIVYGSAQGLLEAPISASVDEGENLWVVTQAALYLLQPGAKVFRRYTEHDGLHYGPGFTEPPHITLVEGGAKGECFVGYSARDTNAAMFKDAHRSTDPWAHMGKMDQVLLQSDGSLKVNRYDLRNTNNGSYYETRTIMSMVYDHFQHPGNLYVGSNHGVTRIIPAKYYPPPLPLTDDTHDERHWYADHVHPWVCIGGPCTPDRVPTFGDWFGLTLAADGRLWMGGLTTAGAINYREKLEDWILSFGSFNPFSPAFEWPPIFVPPAMGDPVNIRGVAVTPNGVVWFVSRPHVRDRRVRRVLSEEEARLQRADVLRSDGARRHRVQHPRGAGAGRRPSRLRFPQLRPAGLGTRRIEGAPPHAARRPSGREDRAHVPGPDARPTVAARSDGRGPGHLPKRPLTARAIAGNLRARFFHGGAARR